MKHNGFGSVQQHILISVPKEHVENALKAFEIRDKTVNLLREDGNNAVLEWLRWTATPDDDETIVYEIGFALDDVTGRGGWKVLWDETQF